MVKLLSYDLKIKNLSEENKFYYICRVRWYKIDILPEHIIHINEKEFQCDH